MRRKTTYDPARDYYLILGVDIQAGDDDLRQAYRERVRMVHPDRNPDRREWATEQIKLLNEAYGVLRDPAQRREYNRLRWPHVPHEPASAGASYRRASRTNTSTFDHDRPWWEHATSAQRMAGAASSATRAPSAPGVISPTLSQWLKDHRLGWFQPALVSLVGMWRSPYGGLLSVLTFVLTLNVAAIMYFVIVPDDGAGLLNSIQEWFDTNGQTAASDTITATPSRLHLSCPDPAVQIAAPVEYTQVGDSLSVYGTIEHARLWNYTLELGYLGTLPPPHADLPQTWRVIRPAPAGQTTRESVVIDGPLAGPVNLAGEPVGYYVVRLRVTLQDQTTLPLCDVVIQH